MTQTGHGRTPQLRVPWFEAVGGTAGEGSFMSATKTLDELTVTTTATQADAQLIVSLINGPLGMRASDGLSLLFSYDEPPTHAQFIKDHPVGSDGYKNMTGVLGLNEILGTFVKQGLLDRGLVHDTLWIAGAWKQCKPLVLHLRDKAGEPRIYENFEALARTA